MFKSFYLEDGNLNDAERTLYDEMRKIKDLFATICIPPLPKKDITSLKDIMKEAHPEVLRDFMRCCVETNTFVPIEKFAVGDWKNDFSYVQRFGMWYGTGFKGIHAYGKEFIEEALNQEVPVADMLWKYHSWMQVKNFSVEKVYNESRAESKKNPQKISLWNSKDPKALAFVNFYDLRRSFPPVTEAEERSVKIVKIQPKDIEKYIAAKSARQRN